MQPRVLYVTYDGALEPLGQSQILPYVRGIAMRGAHVTLLSFEKRRDFGTHRCRSAQAKTLSAMLRQEGIRWIPLLYHKRPTVPATCWDVLNGLVWGLWLIRRDRLAAVHARSGVASSLIGWLLKRISGIRLLHDLRGFWADERREAGQLQPEGLLYRTIKRLESLFLRDAEEVVVLSQAARQTLEEWPGLQVRRVTVIPTCVDLGKFTLPHRPQMQRTAPVFVYAGSIGPLYLLNEMFRFFEESLRLFPQAHFFLLTRNQEEAFQELRQRNIEEDAVTLASLPSAEVPRWLARAHVGLAFYRPGWGRRGMCPTKIGEYLAMGLPVIVNDGVGDVRDLIGGNQVGVVLDDFSTDSFRAALSHLEKLWADPMLSARCRSLAESYFSLNTGVDRYWEIYQRLA